MLSCQPANSHGHQLLPTVKPNVLAPLPRSPCPAPTRRCAEPQPTAKESSKRYKAPFSLILGKYTQSRYDIRSTLTNPKATGLEHSSAGVMQSKITAVCFKTVIDGQVIAAICL